MASGFLIFYGVILTVILLVVASFLFYIIFYKGKRQPSDYAIVRNTYMSQYTRGHAELVLVGVIKGNLRIGLELIPKDIPNLKYFNIRTRNYKIPQSFSESFVFWIPKEKLHSLPIGTASDYKNIYEIEAFNVDDINQNIKNTKLGIVMMNMVGVTNKRKLEKDFIEGEKNKAISLVKNNIIGEITALAFNRLSKMTEESMNILSKDKEKKPSIYTPPYRNPDLS